MLLQCADNSSFPGSREALWTQGNRKAVLIVWTVECLMAVPGSVCRAHCSMRRCIFPKNQFQPTGLGGKGRSRGWLELAVTSHHGTHSTQGIFPGGLLSASEAGPFAHSSRSSSLNCFFHQFRSIRTRSSLPTCYFESVLLTESLVEGFGWSCRGPRGFCEASLQPGRISLKACSFV